MNDRRIAEVEATGLAEPDRFRREVLAPCKPVILRHLIAHWPVVRASQASRAHFHDYLMRFDRGGSMDAFFGAPEIEGRYFYGEGLTGFNFERKRMAFGEALAAILANSARAGAQTIYVGSLPISEYLPGFAEDNRLPFLPLSVGPRIWLGNRSNVSLHFDMLDNVACVVAGRRRVTLFAPEAIDSLYVGPIDNTMAGQPVSLAASAAPDDPRYPRFHAIRDQALHAELEPGDALYLPKLWWHQIEATEPLNGLVNYWWDPFAAGPDQPYAALLLAMIAVSERPAPERAAWRAFFDHYVFRPNGHPLAHIPPERHGLLGALQDNYGRIRARVMHMLRG